MKMSPLPLCAMLMSAGGVLWAQSPEGGAPQSQPQEIYQVDLPEENFENALNAIVAQRLGLRQPYRAEAETNDFGHHMHDVRKVMFGDDARRIPVIIKNYNSEGGEWQKSLHTELEMEAAFSAIGLKTQDMIVVVPNRGVTASRFLTDGIGGKEVVMKAEQDDAESLALMERLGADMAVAHRNNLCVTDLKPTNIMASQGRIVFIDLDQAARCGGKAWNMMQAWDIAWYLYQSARWTPEEKNDLVAKAFVKGYLGNGGSAHIVRQAAGPRCVFRALNDKKLRDFIKAYPGVFQRVRRVLAAAE